MTGLEQNWKAWETLCDALTSATLEQRATWTLESGGIALCCPVDGYIISITQYNDAAPTLRVRSGDRSACSSHAGVAALARAVVESLRNESTVTIDLAAASEAVRQHKGRET